MTLCTDLFSNSQPLRLPGFEDQPVPYGGLEARLIAADPVAAQFERFAWRVIEAIGRSWLPVYRMADGEFAFMVGWHRPASEATLWRRVRGTLSRFRQNVLRKGFSTMWGEAYAGPERQQALQTLEQSVRQIASRGVLAVYFMRRGDRWSEEFFEPVCAWFDRHKIALNADNYVPFYFVYALLNGPRRARIFRGRRVLVVTHLTPERRAGIESALRAEGVSEVLFLPISASRSMFDRLDAGGFRGRCDLALVAAGIGSANVLTQLEVLSIPAIDVGITIECMIDPGRRQERPFLRLCAAGE